MERIIQDDLTVFIQSHIPAADLSGMDEVFFSYVTSVLEDLGSPDSAEENFDMDTFVEMMEAYVPGFADINSGQVCEMMFSLSERLRKAHNKQTTPQNPVQNRSCLPSEALITTKKEGAGTSEDDRLSYSPVGGALAQESGGELVSAVDMMLEMFPACTVSQARKALGMALGNLEEAAQLLLEEKIQFDSAGPTAQDISRPEKSPKQDDCKQFILQKYMMVDSEEDQKTHKPAPPKEAPKKLIRYIDNQVVSTKGERYKDIKKPESEEMKRTYINLKPARKYKFH
ncbi:CUE domain-containing protein 2 [Eublepharis macularius]|uniref:CUE domain-containing protein 2 n=1 Tax=Eublepharis macularius TaxID=481883 RepID=A0AA97JLH9_EUBMA|nr:CUE domain-containing protein 2 [Eublepharis macularius]XP_054839631.1 CUE domain-containing protein 2 [Eublepharis macularius]